MSKELVRQDRFSVMRERLNDTQQLFVDMYLGQGHGNVPHTGRLLGLDEVDAWYIYAHEQVQELIAEGKARGQRAAEVTHEDTWRRMIEQAEGAGQYVRRREDGSHYVDIEALQKDGRSHLIKGFKKDKEGSEVFEFVNPQAGLEKLARALGILNYSQEKEKERNAPRMSEEEIAARVKELLGRAAERRRLRAQVIDLEVDEK